MRKEIQLSHEFVEFIPSELKERTVYVSIPFATAAHKCCCGCGKEVVTPLSPTDWSLIFDGETISLDPSIGNWNFECQSHYWIIGDRVEWAGKWSKEEIRDAEAEDRSAKKRYFGHMDSPADSKESEGRSGQGNSTGKSTWWTLFGPFSRKRRKA
jgi:hypothetical protein